MGRVVESTEVQRYAIGTLNGLTGSHDSLTIVGQAAHANCRHEHRGGNLAWNEVVRMLQSNNAVEHDAP